MRRRLTGSPLKLTVAAAFLLSAILFNGLQLAWMGLGNGVAAAPMAHAMPDGMPCDGGGHHDPGQPHCPVCLVAVSPGLVAALPLLVRAAAAPIGVAEIPAAGSAAPAPAWRRSAPARRPRPPSPDLPDHRP